MTKRAYQLPILISSVFEQNFILSGFLWDKWQTFVNDSQKTFPRFPPKKYHYSQENLCSQFPPKMLFTILTFCFELILQVARQGLQTLHLLLWEILNVIKMAWSVWLVGLVGMVLILFCVGFVYVSLVRVNLGCCWLKWGHAWSWSLIGVMVRTNENDLAIIAQLGFKLVGWSVGRSDGRSVGQSVGWFHR